MHETDTSAIAHEYPVLLRYLGELRFAALLRDCQTVQTTWKQLAEQLPERLSQFTGVASEIAELALLERAMRRAFEVNVTDTNSAMTLHPSVTLLVVHHNTTSLWSALVCGEPPPRPYRLEQPQHVLVWRHKGQSRMRLLGEEEYLCMKSLTPRTTCKVALNDTATPLYIAGWLESDVVLAATSGPAEK